MKYLIRDSACWAAAGLATGVLAATIIAAAAGMELSSAVGLAVLLGGVAMCLGPLALVVHRAAQVAGPKRLAMGALWGGIWGLALGLLYWGFCGNTFPVWNVLLPTAVLAAAGLLNTALDIDMAAAGLTAFRSAVPSAGKPKRTAP
jgi:hypothetical protein